MDKEQDEIYEQLTISPPEQVYCNICGGLMDFWDIQEDFTIHRCVGYGSVHDMEEIKLHMCCECFDRIVEQCAINPVIGERHYFANL